jgi:site-specific recombinase
LLENESAFSAQQIQCLRWLGAYRTHYLALPANPGQPNCQADLEDGYKHLCVLWQQCQDLVDKLHRRASRLGTSMHLSQTLATLRQKLERISALSDLAMHELPCHRQDQALGARLEHMHLMKALLAGEAGRNSVRALLRDTGSTLALRVTDNAARSGEHYITESRSEYYALFRSALGSGLIIAIMTWIKISIMAAHLPALTEALLVCLNYALGFVFIHIIGGTVATKQPAMTAAAIASTLGQNSDKSMASTAQLIARTSRSQIASVLGNIGLAIPSGAAISVLLLYFTGKLPVDADASAAMLTAAHPWLSGALIFAATAGFCLFLSGIVSGYYDNLNAYNRIPDRIRQWGRRHPRIPATSIERLACYIDGHLGALMGNFLFGFMLGGVSALGHMTGLPLDIRHVAFSSAQLGYALAGSGFSPAWGLFFMSALGVALIGLTNLLVSFALALWLAFRARQLDARRYLKLLQTVWALFKAEPRRFFFPPAQSRYPDAAGMATPSPSP